MSGILQMLTGGTYAPAAPTVIGQAFGGGFYAGKINVSGTQYYLIVAPKAYGEATGKLWGTYNVNAGTTSTIDGASSTATLVSLGSDYQAANFCNSLNAGGGLNGYTDWYMPAKNELEVLYYFLKPTTTANDTTSGANINAVSPEPYNTNYTTSNPSQTSAVAFRSGGSEVFQTVYPTDIYMSTTQYDIGGYWMQYFETYAGFQDTAPKNAYRTVRAIRKVLVS